MHTRSRFPPVFILAMLFFLILFATVTYIAYQRKHSGVMPIDISQIQQMRRLVK